MRLSYLRPCAAFLLSTLIAACGATYALPPIGPEVEAHAAALFDASARAGPRAPVAMDEGLARFERVVRRIRPVAEALCRQEGAVAPETCVVPIGIDRRTREPNAYFTYVDPVRKRQPIIRVTLPMLRDMANDDELAFVLGHEYGHLIGRHFEKRQQQALVGALLVGAITAAAEAQNPNGPNQSAINRGVAAGGAAGGLAYSQTYELESDAIGTVIARQAGYDPVRGAGYFARAQEPRRLDGRLSFWGTHPPDARRVATVIATQAALEAGGGLARRAGPQ